LLLLSLIGIILQSMSRVPTYVVGIDGGGTKTAAQLADMQGKVLAESLGGPSNFQVIGAQQAAGTILDLVETCCHSVGCTISQIASITAGLTGAGRVSDQNRMIESLRQVAQSRSIELHDVCVESDARIGLEGAFGGGAGIIVIAGTGSIVFGKDHRGNILRAGGWGRLIGDEGSGYSLGREAFRAVAKAIDGRSKKTLLTALFARKLGLKTQEEIVRALYKDNFDMASVAPVVLEAARKRDRPSLAILELAAEELVDVVDSVVRRMKIPRTIPNSKMRISFVGGLLTSPNIYSKNFALLIRRTLPSVALQKAQYPPVYGAVLLSLGRTKNHTASPTAS
jgi:N-acetylglucosamine kinase-like BadF-type ATPase